MVTNIWNIKQYRTKLHLSMFFVELKSALNNKDIFNVEYTQQCKIKFKPPKHKRDIVQYANCQRYGHLKNYWHLKPRCIKCAGDHFTNQCHRKDLLISDVSSVVEIFLRITRGIWSKLKTKTKLHGLSPRANYTDRATAACRRSDCQLVRLEGATWSA
jgi:hypothetical protein